MDVHFRMLGHGVTLSGPSACLAPIAFAYRNFRVDAGDGAARVVWSESGVATDRGAFPAIPGVEAVQQLYPRFLERFYDLVDDRALLHAATVSDGRRAALLAAPSGHGKSTLAMELATRGLRLDSDDFAPMKLDGGTVAPFPRMVGIAPGPSAAPAAFRAAAADADVRLFGKALVDPAQFVAVGEAGGAELPPQDVFFIAGRERERPRLVIGCAASDAGTVLRELRGIAGVSAGDPAGDGALAWFDVETEPGAESSAALSELVGGPLVLHSSTEWSEPPERDGEPRVEPLSRRAAAQRLVRETLNRRPSGGLMRRYGGDLVGLLLDVGSALRQSRCWTLHPGPPGPTADAIQAVAGLGEDDET